MYYNMTPQKEKIPSLKKNYAYNLAYQILLILTPFITAPYIARVFGAEGVGVHSFTVSVTSYFVLFAVLGTSSYGQREIAQHRDNKKESSQIFWEIELLTTFITSIILIIWGIFVFLFSKEYKQYYLAQTLTIFAVIFDISWFFAGHEQFRFIVIRNISIKIIGITCLFAFIRDRSDLLLYIAILAAIGFLGNLSMWTYLPRFVQKISFKELRPFRHFKQTLTYFIPTIATSVYTVLDKIMIGLITRDANQNGIYEQTEKIVKIGLAVVTSLNTVMGSRMSYLFSQKKYDEIKERLKTSMSFTMFMTIPMTLGLCGIAKDFVPWFFGDGYNEVVPIIYVYSLILIPIGISNCLGGQYLTPSGQRARCSKGIVVGAIVNAALNTVEIPLWGAKGAAVASVFAETVIAWIFLFMSKGYIQFRTIIKFSWRRIIASIVMLVTVILIEYFFSGYMNPIIITILQIVVGIIFYILILLLIRDELLIGWRKNILNRYCKRRSGGEEN